MESRPGRTIVVGSILRSVNAVPGARIGGAAPTAFLIAGLVTEAVTGRPSPTQMAATVIFVFPLLGVAGAVVGAAVGWVIGLVVRRTRLAGPAEPWLVAGTLALVLLIGGFLGVRAVRQSEARAQPRVIHSTGAVARLVGFATLAPDTPAKRLFSGLSGGEVSALSWRGGTAGVALDGETLTLSHDSGVLSQVSLSGLDSVSEVYGVTATDEQGQEWLALLVHRAHLTLDGRRALNKLFKANKRLCTAYLLQESFGQLWDYRTEGWARHFFEHWRDSLKWQRLEPYVRFAAMIDRHWDGIASYCRPENKVSLGMDESGVIETEPVGGLIEAGDEVERAVRGDRSVNHRARHPRSCGLSSSHRLPARPGRDGLRRLRYIRSPSRSKIPLNRGSRRRLSKRGRRSQETTRERSSTARSRRSRARCVWPTIAWGPARMAGMM